MRGMPGGLKDSFPNSICFVSVRAYPIVLWATVSILQCSEERRNWKRLIERIDIDYGKRFNG